MNAPPRVREAALGDEANVAAVLHDAFADEAGLNYWLRQGRSKDWARRRFFKAAVADAIHPMRVLHVAEDGAGQVQGAAIWLNPGDHAYDYTPVQELLLTPLLLRIAGVAGMRRALGLGKRLAAHHPKAPHAHLTFIGVAPFAQGLGVGSALLKATLAPLDAAGTIAFLETSTERNVALYARHGFEQTGVIELPGLRMWAMTRQPRG